MELCLGTCVHRRLASRVELSVLAGGSRLHARDARGGCRAGLSRPFALAWDTYGPTEATVVTTAIRLMPEEPVTIGQPLRGWELAVVDPEGQLVEGGELVVSGVGLGRYLKPELDAERYRRLPAIGWDRAYRTGDIVRQTDHGLEFVGRRDHPVKIGGRQIELGEVDGVLSSSPACAAPARLCASRPPATSCSSAMSPVTLTPGTSGPSPPSGCRPVWCR
jgi:acyl-coenzyme A synthetase/AMP-(fatty) acid ligase